MRRKPWVCSFLPASFSTAVILVAVLMLSGCNNTPTGTQPETGTITDIDGNTYQTIEIGDQLWMAENLKVTHYRNGDAIPNVTDSLEWEELTTGAFCNYDNNESNVATYGRLYNWYAVNDSRNIAPEGWHVPSDIEWQTLVDYLGGAAVAGGKMKEAGTTHWNSPNTGATDESGFSALPGGCRCGNLLGGYIHIRGSADFWSFAESDASDPWSRGLSAGTAEIFRAADVAKFYGFSVRCIRD